jgi:hypothetical protein
LNDTLRVHMVPDGRGSRSAFNIRAGEAMAAIEQIANRELPNGCLAKAAKKDRKKAQEASFSLCKFCMTL